MYDTIGQRYVWTRKAYCNETYGSETLDEERDEQCLQKSIEGINRSVRKGNHHNHRSNPRLTRFSAYFWFSLKLFGTTGRLVEANVSPLYRADIPASNGVIHVVDWILKPTDRDWCENVILPR